MRRATSIRSSLLLSQTLVLVLLGAVLLAATFVGARQAVTTLLRALVEGRVDHVETELRRYFLPVGGALLAVEEWGRSGMISARDPVEQARLLKPLFRQQPQLVSVLVVSEDGTGFALVRVSAPSGGDAPRPGSVAEVTIEPIDPAEGEIDSEWWRGAADLLDEPRRAIFLAPTTPLDRGEGLGLTGSVAFRGREGEVVAVALQTRLAGLVDFVRSMELSEREAISVLTGDFRLLAMSDDPSLWTGPPEGWVLKRPTELGSSLVADAVEAFTRRGEGETGPLEFLHSGEVWWTQLRRFPLGGGDELFISVLVPDTDLGENRNLIRLSILAVILLALFAAVLGSLRLSRRVSAPIEVLVRNSERISQGDLDAGEPVTSRLVEVQELAVAQERMRQGLRSLLKLEGDLQAARRIQQASLPDALPAVRGWDLAGWSEPAEETGGDAYDAIAIGDESNSEGALLLVADATGHGIGAALSAVRVAAMVRIGALSRDDLERLAGLLNEELCDELPRNRFVSAWLGRLDAASGELATLSAGLAPLLLVRAGSDRAEILGADAPPLGLRKEVAMSAPPPLRLEVGDLFVAVTDGFFEATNESGEELGIERIAAVAERERERPAAEILEALRHELLGFTGNTPPADDRTAVVIKRTGA